MARKQLNTDRENQRKAREARAAAAKKISCRTLKRQDRKTLEIPTARIAIQNFCRSCMGYEADDYPSLKERVADCDASHCWLWNYRTGKLTEG